MTGRRGVPAMKHLLIVGRPGVGKTTLLQRLIQALRGQPIDGFITEELREHEQRAGFWLSTVDGRQVLLAHRRMERGVRVGPYRVNTAVLEDVAVPVLERAGRAARVLFVDELGKMELCVPRFERAVQEALTRGPTVVATGGLAPLPFLQALKRRRDVELIPLTPANRAAVEEELRLRLPLVCAEDDRVRAVQQQAERICELIVSGEVPPIDVEIQQSALRATFLRAFPGKAALYPLLYETRFRRLWQQFRHGEPLRESGEAR